MLLLYRRAPLAWRANCACLCVPFRSLSRRPSRQRYAALFELGLVRRVVLRLAIVTKHRIRPYRLVPLSTLSPTNTRVSSVPRIGHAPNKACLRGNRALHGAPFAKVGLRCCSRERRVTPQVWPVVSAGYITRTKAEPLTPQSQSSFDAANNATLRTQPPR